MDAKKVLPEGRLPQALLQLLDGDGLAGKIGATLLLITVAEEGWPHVALLSVGEAVAMSPASLALALWPETRTTANLSHTGKATLFLVHDGAAYTIKIAARRLDDLEIDGAPLACFAAEVRSVATDVADYAELTGGVNFRLHDPAGVVPRWEKTVEAMREKLAAK